MLGVILDAICTTLFDVVLPNKLGFLSYSSAYVGEEGVVVSCHFPVWDLRILNGVLCIRRSGPDN